ncbi:SGNH/GDSL hydrolase family protein [Pleomorphomonas sp. PLEO]|uniref:SGNH/GDSL hydrolase family protein n=1 Tax=Pleomorphomonas sp. PLEO TaxID=3239306 RepID=UPI00351EE470
MKRTFVALAFFSFTSGHVFAQEICPQFPEPLAVKKPSTDPMVASNGQSRTSTDFNFFTMQGVGNEPGIIFVGDSLTQGDGATSKETSYPKRAIEALDKPRKFVVYAAGGKTSTAIADVFSKETVGAYDIGVIWVGRNNVSQREKIVEDVKQISQKFESKKVLVLGVLKGLRMSEQKGKIGQDIDQINNDLRSAFPNAVLDVRTVLACDDYRDNIHLNDRGYAKVGALVQSEITSRGW